MLILALVLVLVFVTSPTSAASQAGTPSAQLSGRVVEDRTGAPISSAHVILLPQPRNIPGPVPLAITDQDGRYSFESVPPGRYRVDVQKAGILPAADPANAPTVTLAAGQAIDDWSVSVQRGGAITGRILDPFGEPLADVTVRAARRNATGAVPSPATANSTVTADLQPRAIPTNDLGEFRVFGLAPGQYVITATPQPVLGLQSITNATLLASTFYPGVSEAMAAQPIAVAAGETVGGVEFRLLTAPAYSVSGVVVDQADAPVMGARVMLRADSRFDQRGVLNMGPTSQINSDASGRFVFGNIPSGLYTVTVSVIVSSGGSRAQGDPIAVRVDDANIEDLRIVVQQEQ